MKRWGLVELSLSLTRLSSYLVVRNTASSFIALGWLSAISVLAIPIYIKLLGVEEWGIVAACVSLQLVFTFLDAGFSQIVPRWVAREANDQNALRSYFRFFKHVYFILALSGFMLLQFSASYLSHSWFQITTDRAQELEIAIRIIAFQMLFQFINNLHIGFWHGLQMQLLANVRVCGYGTLKHLATITILALGSAQAWIYAATFSVVALIEVTLNALTVHRTLGPLVQAEVGNAVETKPLLREAIFLSGGILMGLMVSQLDRIILSHTVPVEDFGIYVVVVTLAMAFLQLQAPLTRAYFPIFVQDIKATGHVSATNFKRLIIGNLIISTLPTLLACVFAQKLLQFWLHDPRFVALGYYPLQLLLGAVAANTIYNCIYQVIVASGRAHLVFKFNLIVLMVVALVVAILGESTGLVLGGAIWLSATSTQLVLGLSWYAFFEHNPNSAKSRK